jgi:hypothetical protein
MAALQCWHLNQESSILLLNTNGVSVLLVHGGRLACLFRLVNCCHRLWFLGAFVIAREKPI